MKGKNLMNIIQPEATVMWKTKEDALNDMRHLEMIGRVCYKTKKRITADSYKEFLKMVISKGEESVLEHVTVSAHICCDRGVSNELASHRTGAFSQDCNYKYDMMFIPSNIDPMTINGQEAVNIMIESFLKAEKDYHRLLELDCAPEIARAILPMKHKTEIFITLNLKEWRHFFKLVLDKAAHCDMRFIARTLYARLYELYPEIFEDIL